MSRSIARPLLVVGIITAVTASWIHLASWFARYETPEQAWVAMLAAVAIDIGLLASLRHVGEQAAAGRPTRHGMAVVAVLVSASFLANVQHAVALRPGDVLNAVMVAGMLPLTALLLSHLYDVASRETAPAPVAAPAKARRNAKLAGSSADDQAYAELAVAVAADRERERVAVNRSAARDAIMAERGVGRAQAYRILAREGTADAG